MNSPVNHVTQAYTSARSFTFAYRVVQKMDTLFSYALTSSNI